MKRKTLAFMLALSMCLSLLPACGSGGTAEDDKPPESEDAVSSTEQPKESEKPEESKEQPEESEEPKEEEPEESEEPKEESNAGTELLALLQEEWNNGFVEGEGPRHTYYDATDRKAFIHNGVVYIRGVKGYGDVWDYCSYDIASKELHESVAISADAKGYGWYAGNYFMDGNFYFANDSFKEAELSTRIYDYNGTPLQSFLHTGHGFAYFFFEKGILAIDIDDSSVILLSHNLEKIADIPAPQREVEHGLKEDLKWMQILRSLLVGQFTQKFLIKALLIFIGSIQILASGKIRAMFRTLRIKSVVFAGNTSHGETAFMTMSQGSRFLNMGNCIPL